MSNLQLVADIAMCLLWVATYALVLVGTIKYQYPLISPITQAIIAPFEFSVILLFVKSGIFRFDYASVIYVIWVIIEIAIIFVMLHKKYVKRNLILPYIGMILLITIIMFYFVVVSEHMFFFSYFNTFIGIIFWLFFVIRHRDFPMKKITLAIFISKMTADVAAMIAYIGKGHLFIQSICILLPLTDAIFIFVYMKRTRGKIP
jgi:hypothetical protein